MTLLEAITEILAGRAKEATRDDDASTTHRISVGVDGMLWSNAYARSGSQRNGCTYTIPMPLDGWTLTPTAFDYAEAMRRVADGKRLRRRAWQPNLLYASLSPCSKVYMEHYEDGYTRNGVTSREDILATDWHEVGG